MNQEPTAAYPDLHRPNAYLEQEARATEKSEYYAGVIIPIPGVQPAHDKLKMNITRLFILALDEHYELVSSDVRVHIPATNTYVYPDLTVVAGARLFDAALPIPALLNPHLIVEVLSDSTQGYDKRQKFAHYQTIPTFREYLDQSKMHIITHAWCIDDNPTWHQTTQAPATICSRSAQLS